MDFASTIDTIRHDTNCCVLKIVVIGSIQGVINILSSLKNSKRYVCDSVIVENYYGVNFWKYFSLRSGFKEKLKLLFRTMRTYRSLKRKYKEIFRGIRFYYNSTDISDRLFDIVPQKVFDDADLFLLVRNDASYWEDASWREYKISDYASGLIRLGISKKKIFVVPDAMTIAEIPVIENEKLSPLCRNLSEIRPVLRYMEYQVTDFCNLKCKGCTHIANKVNKIEFAGADKFRLSLEKLRKKFSNITVLRIMGGEPLLCKELHEYIDAAHDVFPYSQIKIVTNGLLYRNITQRTIESIRNACAEIQVTQYPPTRKIADEIIAFCGKNGLKVSLSCPVEEFYKRHFLNEMRDPQVSWSSCDSRYCHLLHDTVLFPCSFIWTKTELGFRNMLGREAFTDNDRKELSYDLSKEIADDGWDMLMKLESPMRLCGTCGEKTFFKWESEAGIN